MPDNESRMLIDMVRDFANNVMRPQVDEMEANSELPREVFRQLGELGLLSLAYPEEYGGGGQPYEVYLQVVEEIATAWMSVAVGVSVHSLTINPVYAFGTDEQKERMLHDMLGGTQLGAYALSEPDAGSDVANIQTAAVKAGDQYRLTNDFRYNCRRSTSPNNCSYVDRGASQGTRIYYNAARVTLLDQGSKRLSEINPSDNDRYVSWAIFRQNSTGKRFLFADTHLEAKDGTYLGASYDALRLTQAKEVQAAVTRANVDALPVILVGDLNSSRWSSPANYPYDVFTAGGLVDHLGNVYKNSYALTGADVNHRIRTSYSSFNGYRLAAPRTTYLNGTYIDYILTTPMAMTEYQNVVSVDSAGMFLPVLSGGNVVIPSDHNLQRASVRLP